VPQIVYECTLLHNFLLTFSVKAHFYCIGISFIFLQRVIIRCSSYEEGSCIYTHLHYQGVQAGFLHEQELDSDTYLTSWLLGKHGVFLRSCGSGAARNRIIFPDPGPFFSSLMDPHSTYENRKINDNTGNNR
jgi:hypothetical protein